MLPVVFTTMALTLVVVVVALNFTTGEKKIEQKIERLYAVEDPHFLRAMGVLLGPAIVGGNRFEVLLNGDRIFPSMLDAIRGAQKTITFESYIYWSGTIGQKFADALAERARAGVKVHVLLDWVGSGKMEDALLTVMEEAGVELKKFHQPHWSLQGHGRRCAMGVGGFDQQWQQRPLAEKVWEHTAALLRGQL